MKLIRSRSDIIKNSLAVFVVLLVSVVGVALLTSSHAATGATLSLSSSSTSVAPGSNFSVTIKEDSGSDPINTVQAGLNYDATQLQFVGLSEGTAFPTVAATSTSTPGVILVGRATQATPVTGSNDVVTANFKVLATSGSIGLSFDKNYSFVVRSTDNVDVLSTTTGGLYTVTGASTASASMSLSPATASVDSGSTVAVTVRENSGTAAVNSVQSLVGYDATKLQYLGLTEQGTFTNVITSDSGTTGQIKIGRSVQAGSTGVSGDNPIVTLNFKVLASSGTTDLTIDKTQSFVTESASSNNILTTVAGNALTITSVATSSSTLELSPTGGTYTQGSTISVAVKASSTQKLTTVQATLNYPASQLQFMSATEGGVFTTAQRTNSSTAGVLDIIRSLPGGSTGVTGTNPVVTVTFKVLGSSGSAAVTFGTTSALYDDTGTGTNILNLATSTNASYTLAPNTVPPPPPPPPAGTASFSLTPANGSYTQDSTVSVTIKANSATSAITTVEPVIDYPASQLQYVSTTAGSIFTTAQRTNSSTAGVLDIIRSIPGGSTGVTGDNTVVTVNFKVIGSSGVAALTYGAGTAIFDDGGSGTNIYSSTNSTGASYTIASIPTCSSNPTVPGSATKTASSYTTISLSWAASTAGANCTLAGYHVYRDGAIAGDVTSGTSFTDSGLASGTSYSYTIKAFDTAGHTSSASPAASLTSKADDMAPTTPVGVTAAAPDAASVNLSWSPSTDFPNPGGVGLQGYKVYRNGATSATYTVNNATAFIDSNVSADTTYSYTITSFDKLGNESAPSNIVSAKTQPGIPTCSGSPSTPTSLTSGTSTLTATSLSWSSSTAASGCTLAGYRVYRDAALIGTVSVTNFGDSGLTSNTSYNYTVQAYDTDGHSSALSTAKTIATLADTTAPTAPGNVTAVAPSAGLVTISWSASTDNVAVTGYKLYRGGSLIVTRPASARTHDDTTVTADSDYTYTVSAIDAAGNESAKTTATPNPVHTPATADTQAPTVPSGLQTSVVSTNSTIFGWSASTDNVGVNGYHVYRGGVLIGDATTTSYTDPNLTANTTYDYTVKAFDAAGNTSAASDTLSVTTLQDTVGPVGDLNSDGVVELFDLSIILSHWNDQNVPVKSGDINQDGKVDQSDLDILLSHLGDTL